VEPRLVAGDEQIHEFAREVWTIDDPIICIWKTEKSPDLLDEDLDGKFVSIDLVNFYSKEHFHSLFFPFGFQLGVYNLVLAGIKDDNSEVIHVPMNGMLKGWLLGTDMKELMINLDLEI